MADDVTIKDAFNADKAIATDDVGSVQFQKVKIDVGADGVSAALSSANPMPISDAGGSLTVDGTVAISGSVAVTGPLTDAQIRATALPVSGTVTATGPLTDAQLRASAVPVSGTVGISGSVTIADGGGSITVDGPLTDTQLRAVAVPVSGTVTATGPLTDAQLRATSVPVSDGGGSLTVDGTVAISGSVAVTGPLTDTQLRASAVPVSAASLPLPTGAATETTLSAINTKTPALGQAAMAASSPVVIASNQSAVPISAASLPLPTGAATETTLAAVNTKTPSLGQAAMAASTPVVLASNQTDITVKQNTTGTHFQPGYDISAGAGMGGNISTDPEGHLVCRSQVLTDEGGFRVNFANSSLSVSIGTCTFTASSSAVTGTGFIASDLRVGDYVKRDADGETAWVQIESLDSDTAITLVSVYAGTTGTSASSRAIVKPVTGSGAAIAVASGACTLTLGTTNSALTEIERDVDWLPLVYQAGITVSQRIANQTLYFGFYDEVHPTTPYWFAWFALDGTTNTTLKCQSGRNPSGAPSASETEETTVTLPNGATTATARRYRVEVLGDRINFLVDGIILATHYKAMPGPGDLLTATIRGLNGTGAGSSTVITADYLTVKNHNKLEVGILSDTESVVTSNVPMQAFNYSVAGVIAINTVLQQIDCTQARTIFVQCVNMGTTGVVTPEFSNDGVTWVPATLVTSAGVSALTFNAAGQWSISVVGRYFQLRLSTATTAGTTTLSTYSIQSPISTGLATQTTLASIDGKLRALGQTTMANSMPVAIASNQGAIPITTIIPGTAATNLGKAEDAAAASGDTGIFALGVRRDDTSGASPASATGDYNELAVNRKGALQVAPFESTVRYYRAAVLLSTFAASATDVVDIFGNATTTVEIRKVKLTGIATAATNVPLYLLKRTTANTVGTRNAMTAVRMNTADTAASSIPGSYTANPTTGTLEGNIGIEYMELSTNTSIAGMRGILEWDFCGNRKAPTLIGTGQGLALNFNGASAPAGLSLSVEIEWAEYVA